MKDVLYLLLAAIIVTAGILNHYCTQSELELLRQAQISNVRQVSALNQKANILIGASVGFETADLLAREVNKTHQYVYRLQNVLKWISETHPEVLVEYAEKPEKEDKAA